MTFIITTYHLTEFGSSDLLRVTRPSGATRTRLGDLSVPTVEQRQPILIQAVAEKKRQIADQHRGGATDELVGASLRARGHHQREDQTLLGRERDPNPDAAVLARRAAKSEVGIIAAYIKFLTFVLDKPEIPHSPW